MKVVNIRIDDRSKGIYLDVKDELDIYGSLLFFIQDITCIFKTSDDKVIIHFGSNNVEIHDTDLKVGSETIDRIIELYTEYKKRQYKVSMGIMP